MTCLCVIINNYVVREKVAFFNELLKAVRQPI
jgi:hypothetical protein